MEREFVAILMQKEVIDEKNGLFLFKPINVLDKCDLNFETEILIDNIGKEYFSINDASLAMSEHVECYGYPMEYSDLKKNYPKLKREEVLKKYYEEINKNIYFGKLDKEEIKIILSKKENITKLNDEEYFSSFRFELGDIEKEDMISIPSKLFEDIFDAIQNKDKITSKNNLDKLLLEVANLLGIEESKIKDISKQNPKQLLIEQKEENLQEKYEELFGKKTNKELLEKVNKSLLKLNELIGLDNVKEEISKLVKYLLYLNKVEEYAIFDNINLHMLFTGNPGTGKTTVARLLADIFYNMGYIKENKCAEITAKDLIAGYVGQTAIKTAKVLEENKSGVIFIDEAYVLASDSQKYADEAIVEIIKEMEKKQTIFIFAGYTKEMDNFIKLNPGLRSRTGYYIEYKDYTIEELIEIFKYKINKYDLKITNDALEKLKSVIEKAKQEKDFGNGRFIDKLYEKLIIEHAVNTENIDDKETLLTINKNDITDEMVKKLVYKDKKNKIGF